MTPARSALSTNNQALQPIIPVYRPDLSGNERNYITDCIDSSWISSNGVYIERFEQSVASYTGAENAIAVCNGTVALHLALHCLGVGPGDEVIVPSFTYIASVNAIAQTGATPVFAECKASDWIVDVTDVRERITTRTKAILVVHLYGAAADMNAFCALAGEHGLAIVEDCAEAIGTRIAGRHVGTFGDVGTFSFFGNKTITTGEGGMVICGNPDLAGRLRTVKGQGQSAHRRYWHEVLGFNYRMTNICAAIGLAQMERTASIIESKRRLAVAYKQGLADLDVSFQRADPGVWSCDWLVSLLLPAGTDRDQLGDSMRALGVDTRPVFYCAHTMPMYQKGERFPVSEDIAARGLSLPSYPSLSDQDLQRVQAALRHALAQQGLS